MTFLRPFWSFRLLTWSRGQNEYGAGIAGPLPRSWMKGQWALQKQILGRYRELGIVGQLPAFQGNVPVGLKALKHDVRHFPGRVSPV